MKEKIRSFKEDRELHKLIMEQALEMEKDDGIHYYSDEYIACYGEPETDAVDAAIALLIMESC